MDIWRVRRASIYAFAALALFYTVAFLLGLYAGASIIDFFDPALSVISILIPTPLDVAFDIGVLIFAIYICTTGGCYLARHFIFVVIYISYRIFFNGVISILTVFAILTFIIWVVAAVMPPLFLDEQLTLVSGWAGAACLLTMTHIGWLFWRYRWGGQQGTRSFDRDVGAAFSHYSDPRIVSTQGFHR